MLNNIVYPKDEIFEEYRMCFYFSDDPYGGGFAFECNKDGSIDIESMNPGALENLAKCLFGIYDVSLEGIIDYSRLISNDPYGKCDCGETVYLSYDYGHGIDCRCGRIYNTSGQELAPRSQWEEYYDDDSSQPYYVEFGYMEV
jgi:hypothetical protein